MDTTRIRDIKRIGTWLAVGLIVSSVGLMLLGWAVPRKAAFEAGVFGFQLFPVAILVVLVRSVIPFVGRTSFGKMLIGLTGSVLVFISGILSRVWDRAGSSVAQMTNGKVGYREQNQRFSEDLNFIDASSPVKDAFRNPLRYGPLNTCPTHEDPISNPDGYIPDYEAAFDEEAPD